MGVAGTLFVYPSVELPPVVYNLNPGPNFVYLDNHLESYPQNCGPGIVTAYEYSGPPTAVNLEIPPTHTVVGLETVEPSGLPVIPIYDVSYPYGSDTATGIISGDTAAPLASFLQDQDDSATPAMSLDYSMYDIPRCSSVPPAALMNLDTDATYEDVAYIEENSGYFNEEYVAPVPPSPSIDGMTEFSFGLDEDDINDRSMISVISLRD
ncbi:hypothetical protein BDN72DRAFT_848059 [Pluteus cervinus]|uniref:Uncharacterized protein n=1 Tax=Pluteus cervinus TaxID=181527 RepID=A0ACD3AB11_9AGAR|nr:hypothetical protein BDN72DRAFT_848059 [Pluteus cervinus]